MCFRCGEHARYIYDERKTEIRTAYASDFVFFIIVDG